MWKLDKVEIKSNQRIEVYDTIINNKVILLRSYDIFIMIKYRITRSISIILILLSIAIHSYMLEVR